MKVGQFVKFTTEAKKSYKGLYIDDVFAAPAIVLKVKYNIHSNWQIIIIVLCLNKTLQIRSNFGFQLQPI